MLRYSFGLLFSVLTFVSARSQEAWDLEKCISYAMQNNITVQQSRLNIERSEINLKQSKLALLPSLNAGASTGYNFGQRIDPFTNQFATERVRSDNLFMASSLDLFNGFSKMNRIRLNEESLYASVYDMETIKNDISLQICLAYLRVLQNKESLALSQNQVQITQQQVDQMDRLVEAGTAPRGNLYDLESQLAQEELNVVNAQNSVNIALLNLTQLLQIPRDSLAGFDIVKPDLSDEGTELLTNSAEDIYIRAKQNMPQIKAAESRQKLSEYSLGVARGQLYPSLSISGTLGSGYSGINRVQTGDGTNIGQVPIGTVFVDGADYTVVTLQDQIVFDDADFETKDWSNQLEDNFNQNVQLSLSIPIFNGWSAKSNVELAKIDQVDADLSYQQISNQLRFDIEQAYADAKASMNSYLAAQKAVNALEESFKYAQVRYDQSVINAVDYNTTKTQFTNAKVDLLRAKYDFVFRTKILDFYMGNPITL